MIWYCFGTRPIALLQGSVIGEVEHLHKLSDADSLAQFGFSFLAGSLSAGISVTTTPTPKPLDVLLYCIPVSWALNYTARSATLIFEFSVPGIEPLVLYRTSCIENNTLELVQGTLLVSLLSNLLLMLGMAFLLGPLEQEPAPMVVQVNSSLMMAAIVVPTVLNRYLEERVPARGMVGAVVLTLVYCVYLYYQFFSYKHPPWPFPLDGLPIRSEFASRLNSSIRPDHTQWSLMSEIFKAPGIEESSSSFIDGG
ncbi:hypothetical protein DFS33DRAFT_1457237 [Desarmillaria ectypa]|nr:hypothetical protein DFS33DRAFT_1457237 [Desarmillaria ectypa]